MFSLSRFFTARTLRGALAVTALLLGTSIHAKAAGDAEMPGEVLVKLTSADALGALLIKHQLTKADQFGARPIFRLKLIGVADLHAKIDALIAEPTVLIAEPNFVHQSPEARRGNNAWAIGTESAYVAQWAPSALHLAAAQALTTGAGMRVAVLDTGIDGGHPLFAGRLLPGFDFVDFDSDPSEVGDHQNNPSFGHGTHVAGLIALVAPGAKIMPLRVLDANGQGNAWVLAEALLYAVDPDGNPASDDGAHVINLSLGSLGRTQILDTIGRLATCSIPPVVVTPKDDLADPGYNGDRARCAASAGAVVVAAAGNDASDALREYPAAEGVYGLVAVGASTSASRLASFSNFGGWIDFAAPGEGITSSVPGGGYGTWSGTSMAAPLAAGTAVLVRALNPGLSPRDVAKRLATTSGNLCGTQMRRLDAEAAVKNVLPAAINCR